MAMDNDRLFLIPCRTCQNENRTLLWRINGVDYTESDLPVFYIPSPSGLLIGPVDVSMNGTTFQCILPTENASPMQTSCLGVLTVNLTGPGGFILENDTLPQLIDTSSGADVISHGCANEN